MINHFIFHLQDKLFNDTLYVNMGTQNGDGQINDRAFISVEAKNSFSFPWTASASYGSPHLNYSHLRLQHTLVLSQELNKQWAFYGNGPFSFTTEYVWSWLALTIILKHSQVCLCTWHLWQWHAQ